MIPRSYMAADQYTVNAICGYRKSTFTGIDEWKVQWDGFEGLSDEFTWEQEEYVSHLTLWKEFEQIRTNQLSMSEPIPRSFMSEPRRKKQKKSTVTATQNNKHMLFSSDSDAESLEFKINPHGLRWFVNIPLHGGIFIQEEYFYVYLYITTIEFDLWDNFIVV
eukprot:271676_1